MRQKVIHTLLTRFFANDCPESVRQQFGTWLTAPAEQEEKDAAMLELWNSLPETTELSSLVELRKVRRRIQARGRRRRLRWIAAAAILLLPLLGLAVERMFSNYTSQMSETKWAEYFVPNGERRQLTLPDGSTVCLNAGSVLLCPEKWGKDERSLYLSGEAHFTVAKDAKRPFIVKTSHIEVEALGTVFSVQAYPDAENVTAMLESGSVRIDDVSGQAAPLILHPDEQAVYNLADASLTKQPADAVRANSWTQGYLAFQQESLSRIFQALERKYNVRINYRDSKFTKMTFTVRFHADESLAEALEILKRIGADFHYKIIDKDVYIN
jgi:ferric-dicitrate binding protein FerR (iron transport regulator)